MTRRAAAPAPGLEALAGALERAGLRGHGGAGFPTATKLRAVAAAGRRPVVVVNGSEGEPFSGKDRFLLGAHTDEVLGGALLCAGALGARRVIVAVPAETPSSRAAVEAAIAGRSDPQRRAAPRIEVTSVPAGYVTGQETSLINVLSGGPAVPTATPPYPFERGIDGRPTLVINAETSVQVARVAAGTYDASRYLTVSGAVARPRVIQARPGTTVRQALGAAGGLSAEPRAVLLGGYGGTWVAAPAALDLVLEESRLRSAGLTLGPGIVHVLGAGRCGVAEVARISRWMAGESAGQCGPCVFGLEAIAGALEDLCTAHAAGLAGPAALERIRRWCAMVQRRGGCAHPDGVARFVTTALDVLAREFEDHASHGPCERCPDSFVANGAITPTYNGRASSAAPVPA